MPTVYHERADALAHAMRSRRLRELPGNPTVAALAEKFGITKKTLYHYESGKIPRRIESATLDKIDKAYDWTPGTARAILDGKNPPLSPDSTPTDLAQGLSQMFGEMIGTMGDLKGHLTLMSDVLEEHRDHVDPGRRREIDAALNANKAFTRLVDGIGEDIFRAMLDHPGSSHPPTRQRPQLQRPQHNNYTDSETPGTVHHPGGFDITG